MQDDGDVSSNDGVSDCETGEETGIPRRRPKTNSLGNAFFNQVRGSLGTCPTFLYKICLENISVSIED